MKPSITEAWTKRYGGHDMRSNREEIFWLSQIPGITASRIKMLLSQYHSIEELANISKKEVREENGFTKKGIVCWHQAIDHKQQIISKLEYLERKSIYFTTFEEENYPELLKNIYDMPYWLYYKGKLPRADIASVAIVGSRTCSAYGKQVAQWMGAEMAKEGIQTISGMAAGIDTAGHIGTLDYGGNTWAVLGGGVDICYPQNNIELYMQIQEKGGIISESSPGTPSLPYLFPIRNRIISALSDAVVVVEARKRSGSLITAELALEQGREVFAVPGKFGDSLSEGCNKLIQDGAFIVTEVEDIVKILKQNRQKKALVIEATKKTLAKEKKIIYSELSFNPISFEELLIKTGFSIGQLMSLLLEMEFDGLIYQPMKNYYIRKLN